MFDSHFHLTDPRLLGCVANGVEIGANFEELGNVFEFASQHKNVYCTAGVHPHYANDFVENDFVNFVAANIENKKFVAIGECGLDYHRNERACNARQIEVLLCHISVAHKYNKPLVVHSRAAAADTMEILSSNKDKLKNGVLIHCMSYTADWAKELMLKLKGIPVYFAFGGHITYKENGFLADTLRAIPRDRILIETDAPYLAPGAKRGEVNRPEYIEITAARMAEILNLTTKEVDDLTTSNAAKFFFC